VPEDMPIEHKMISSSIEAAQKKVEGHNFDIRKHVVQYDDVMNRQREVIYNKRKAILLNENLKDDIWQDIRREIEGIVNFHCVGHDRLTWNLKEVIENVKTIFNFSADDENKIKSFNEQPLIIDWLLEKAKTVYAGREKEMGEETWRQVERAVCLRVIDVLWVDHLDAMVKMREGIGLIGYAQKDPLAEYKQEAYTMFQRLLTAIASDVTHMIFRVRITSQTPPPAETEAKKKMAMKGAEEPKGDFKDEAKEIKAENKLTKVGKVGRNDPCPCGAVDPATGKPIKYKKCCGK